MPIPDYVWNDLIDMEPGQLKSRASVAKRWGGDSVVAALIDPRHLKPDGGRIARTKVSADAALLWEVLPEDGVTMGNRRAQTELGWRSTRRYDEARQLLLATTEGAVGRGRGGAVRRLNADLDATPEPPSKGARTAENPAPAPPAKQARPKKPVRSAKSLEATLWDAADELRGMMDSAQYKHVVLGPIFLKYVSDTFMVRHDELARLVDDPSPDYFMPNEAARASVLGDREEYTAEGDFWIPEGHRWEDLRKAATQAAIGSRVDAAMEAIERDNPTLKGVLPKDYTRRELSSEPIGGLIDTFSRQDLAAEEFKDLDVLGRRGTAPRSHPPGSMSPGVQHVDPREGSCSTCASGSGTYASLPRASQSHAGCRVVVRPSSRPVRSGRHR